MSDEDITTDNPSSQQRAVPFVDFGHDSNEVVDNNNATCVNNGNITDDHPTTVYLRR